MLSTVCWNFEEVVVHAPPPRLAVLGSSDAESGIYIQICVLQVHVGNGKDELPRASPKGRTDLAPLTDKAL